MPIEGYSEYLNYACEIYFACDDFFWSIWEQNLIKIQVKNYNMTISKASGNFLSASERFTIFVIDQARILALSFKIWVGHGIGHMIFWVIAE